jgi:hypothetical protein
MRQRGIGVLEKNSSLKFEVVISRLRKKPMLLRDCSPVVFGAGKQVDLKIFALQHGCSNAEYKNIKP